MVSASASCVETRTVACRWSLDPRGCDVAGIRNTFRPSGEPWGWRGGRPPGPGGRRAGGGGSPGTSPGAGPGPPPDERHLLTKIPGAAPDRPPCNHPPIPLRWRPRWMWRSRRTREEGRRRREPAGRREMWGGEEGHEAGRTSPQPLVLSCSRMQSGCGGVDLRICRRHCPPLRQDKRRRTHPPWRATSLQCRACDRPPWGGSILSLGPSFSVGILAVCSVCYFRLPDVSWSPEEDS